MFAVPAGMITSASFTNPASTAGAEAEPLEPFFTDTSSAIFFFVFTVCVVSTPVDGSMNFLD